MQTVSDIDYLPVKALTVTFEGNKMGAIKLEFFTVKCHLKLPRCN